MAIVKGESYSVGGRIDRYTFNPRATPTIVFNKRKKKAGNGGGREFFCRRHWRAKGNKTITSGRSCCTPAPLGSVYCWRGMKDFFDPFSFLSFSLCQTTISFYKNLNFFCPHKHRRFCLIYLQQLYKSHTTTGCKFESLSGAECKIL